MKTTIHEKGHRPRGTYFNSFFKIDLTSHKYDVLVNLIRIILGSVHPCNAM